MPSTAKLHEERAELEAVFASGIFSRAPGLAQMLTYVCTKYFDGQSGQVKEYNVAVEALGRPAGFDPRRDSIVRVEAHRLRKRLSEYYAAEGASHRVRIVLPSGQYVPRFVKVDASPAPIEVADVKIVPVLAPAQQPPAQTRLPLFVWALAGLIAVSSIVYLAIRSPFHPIPVSAAVTPLPEGPEIHILAGATQGPFTDQLGRNWEADRYFTGGWVVSAPGHAIEGSRDSTIYQNSREGDFQYDIPLKPGAYELHLHFAETVYGERNPGGGGETSRLFQVDANDRQLLSYFDVVSDAHGASVADERVFKDLSPASDGKLHLRFTHRVRDAFVNAIEVLPGIPGRLRPIRIAMRAQPYVDKRGNLWMSDRYYRGGQSVLRATMADPSEEPELYRGERYGNISYIIPVAPGSYQVTFKFSEAWFGPSKPEGGGIGSRVFDILANTQMLAHNFDIYKEAGGPEHELDRTFHNLRPNAQGKLVLSLVPVQNYACVNAIEVTEEGR